ncbi:conserved hypothetical protein [Desulfamplus magnetovallimortis]|uniref:Polymerase beta nucleotidyltransferase domain-containing protein n=1 Tax=Desulfamplus magnetovallimortis TaxID=1246637 RepID=A0A1W1HG17_9BACT|nr:nucleotidyltransferase domain-containing protein [Desulfamplus magnetovallimortis]SLM31420.1 conserved hypothetical protein [Desulfamplus magnetovallimortis]
MTCKLSINEKNMIKKRIKDILSSEEEVQKIVVFGSFLESDMPNDIDIAVFQNSSNDYLPLSMKYRRLLRGLLPTIPYDIVPIHFYAKGSFLEHIKTGDIIFER